MPSRQQTLNQLADFYTLPHAHPLVIPGAAATGRLFCQQTVEITNEEDVRRFHAGFRLMMKFQANRMINMALRFAACLRRRFAATGIAFSA